MEKISGRKRIKDRGIEWKEHYHTRSESLKKRFNKKLGPMSYMRYQGHDFTTNSDYFIVIGPSVTKEGKKKFFAGIKKLPEDPHAKVYAPSGEYFSSIKGALSYASEKWALPFPGNVPDYTERDLANVEIPKHIKGESKIVIEKKSFIEYKFPETEIPF